MRSVNTRIPLDVIKRAVLVAVSIVAVITLHELVHLIVGRLSGVPAVFTGMTSAGIAPTQVIHYAPSALAWMNGIAPLLTVILGFAVYAWLKRRPSAMPSWIRYFFAWWAVFGIPYFGIQLIIVVMHVDYSGNGADSAAIAGYLHLPTLLRVALHAVGGLYYMISSVWVLAVMRTALPRQRRAEVTGSIAPWRRALGLALVLLAIVCIAIDAESIARHGLGKGSFMLLAVLLAWTIGSAVLTRWADAEVRTLTVQWLLPGAIGMAALVPLSLVDARGNDYFDIWQISLPPVLAALAFATHRIGSISDIIPRSGMRSIGEPSA